MKIIDIDKEILKIIDIDIDIDNDILKIIDIDKEILKIIVCPLYTRGGAG